MGLRDALDHEIFKQTHQQVVIVMSKNHDFIKLLEQHSPPLQIIWITYGNTPNVRMREILSVTLLKAKGLLEGGEAVVEISGK